MSKIHPTRFEFLVQAVKSHGDSDACLEWPYCRLPKGYGKVLYGGKVQLVHRIAFKLFRGGLDSSQCALHKCDNPPCFNPKHLFAGTLADNIHDAMIKGRKRYGITYGEESHFHKLTETDVREIRRLYRPGAWRTGAKELALRFGISDQMVADIGLNRAWRHILPQ